MSEEVSREDQLAYNLGMVTGNAIAVQNHSERLHPTTKDKETHEHLQRAISHLKSGLFRRVLPDIITKDIEEAFYDGLTFVLVRTRTPLSSLVGIASYLPGNPGLREAITITSDAIKEGRVFRDILEGKNLEATNDAGKLIIQAMIHQLGQLRRERQERENSSTPQK